MRNASAHTHTHTHTERTSRIVFAVTRFQRALFTGAKEMHQNSTTTRQQTLFAFSSSLPSASQDISLTLNISRSELPTLALRATRKLRAHVLGGTDLALAFADLRHSMPYITSHLGNCTAPAPRKARAVCVVRLTLLGKTSNTVPSGGLRLWQTHQEQRQKHQHAPDLARCCWRPAHGGNGPSCPLARAKALQSA